MASNRNRPSTLPDFAVKLSLILERAFPTYSKLELAGTAVVFVMMDRYAIIKPERSDREVQPDAETPVIAVVAEIISVGVRRNTADIIKRRDAQPWDNGNTILDRGKPECIATNGLIKPGLPRTHGTVLKPAQRIHATQVVT